MALLQQKVYLAEFLKTCLKKAQNIHSEPGGSRVSGDFSENFHRGLAVLVGVIVKITA